MDGLSSAPLNMTVECRYFNISGRTTISAQWKQPLKPNGKLVTYQVLLNGLATYRTEKGTMRNETFGPKVKSVNEGIYKAEYDNVPLNTNYTIQVSGVTRSKRTGEFASATCSMPRSKPEVGRILWGPIKTDPENWALKLFLPRISERNGPICGYRIYIIRLPQDSSSKTLPTIDHLNISTYNEVHAVNNTKGGAYIAEILSSDSFQPEILLGDGHTIKDSIGTNSMAAIRNEGCKKLLNGFYVRNIHTMQKPVATTEQTPAEGWYKFCSYLIILLMMFFFFHLANVVAVSQDSDELGPTKAPIVVRNVRRIRRRRQPPTNAIQIENEENGKATTIPATAAKNAETININEGIDGPEAVRQDYNIYDGPLDPNSFYSGFVEAIGRSR